MWTNESRARYGRSHLRYPSDLTDEERALIPPAKRGGNKQCSNLRAVQILFGHTKIESTVRYLGVDIADALTLSEGTPR
jgi:hypothetical protein